MTKRNQVLFLCTGNYYRSRFAELLFNHLARPAKVNWVADSRALNITAGHNVGPISQYAVEGLRGRGIRLPPSIRSPKQVSEEDLGSSTLIIALNQKEHRPLLESAFSRWTPRVEYWHVYDLGQCTAENALAEIERSVRELIVRIRRSQDAAA